jgi:hypothetical protein
MTNEGGYEPNTQPKKETSQGKQQKDKLNTH